MNKVRKMEYDIAKGIAILWIVYGYSFLKEIILFY